MECILISSAHIKDHLSGGFIPGQGLTHGKSPPFLLIQLPSASKDNILSGSAECGAKVGRNGVWTQIPECSNCLFFGLTLISSLTLFEPQFPYDNNDYLIKQNKIMSVKVPKNCTRAYTRWLDILIYTQFWNMNM